MSRTARRGSVCEVHDESEAPTVPVTVERTDGTTRIDVADAGPPIPDMGRSISGDEAARTPL